MSEWKNKVLDKICSIMRNIIDGKNIQWETECRHRRREIIELWNDEKETRYPKDRTINKDWKN